MSYRSHCGPAPKVTAGKKPTFSSRQNITTSRQIKSLSQLYVEVNQLTHAEVCDQLQRLGFEHTERVPSSGEARIPARGKGPNNQSAAIRWTPDGQGLHWCDFATDDKGTVFAGTATKLDPAEVARRNEWTRIEKLKREAEKRQHQEDAANLAKKIWPTLSKSETHDYAVSKGLAGIYTARIDPASNVLYIPMWVSGVGLVNQQRIYPDGTKRFLKGGRVKGAYSIIGSLNGAEKVLICEGWATGATLHEQTDRPVVIAFNAGNLSTVCHSLRSRFTRIEIVVCGDDDRRTHGNPGRCKATEAATQVGGKVTFPNLCLDCDCTDFNDQANCEGHGAGAV